MNQQWEYEDIVNLPNPTSRTHPRMAREHRAAQFSAFAALTGYKAVIDETGRITQEWTELTQGQLEMLNRKLGIVLSHLKERPVITVTFFEPDEKKEGGAYRTIKSIVTKVDVNRQRVYLEDGTEIDMKYIKELEGEILEQSLEMEM